MFVSSAFDSGNIQVIDATEPSRIRLAIRPDAGEDHYQWFHFRLTGVAGQPLRLCLENAGGASYPKGWEGYRACASYDRTEWFRVSSSYTDGVFSIDLTPKFDSVWLAYFAPYSYERHLDLIARASQHSDARVVQLGTTVDGRDLDLLRVGQGPRPAWFIARQHPGETMAEWLMEGLIERLLDDADPIARGLRAIWTLHLVPNMNPDGAVRGHLRNNAAGTNLNRAWAEPSEERSPEVKLVRAAMEESGVDFFLDVHGDEALPYNFVAGAEGTPSWDDQKAELQTRFLVHLSNASPDFQTRFGYPAAKAGQANMTMATNWVAERFGCLAMTLEQPFKDTADTPHPDDGWSPARARNLGRAVLSALWAWSRR